MALRELLRPPVVVTYLLFCLFGVGSWIAVNGIWAESSLLVLTLPECAKLPAILVVVIQIANVGPLTYTAVRYLFQRFGWSQIYLEISTVFLLVAVGVTSCVLLSIFWSETASVFGHSHSVALITLSFTLALVDCTSSVVFVPFMKHFPTIYISGLYIGEGLSGVLPSVVALSQGFVNNSLYCLETYPGVSTLGIYFSPNVYFIFLAVMMVLCGVAFLAIITVPMVRRQMIPMEAVVLQTEQSEYSSADAQSEEEEETSSLKEKINDEDGATLLEDSTVSPKVPLIDTPQNVETRLTRKRMFRLSNQSRDCPQGHRYPNVLRILWRNFTILFCLGLLSFLSNGSLSAISAYAYLPYGNTTYHVAINLGLLANPIATFVYVFLSHRSKRLTVALSSLACLLAVYVLVAALLAPDPPMKDSLAGQILIVSCAMFVQVLFTLSHKAL